MADQLQLVVHPVNSVVKSLDLAKILLPRLFQFVLLFHLFFDPRGRFDLLLLQLFHLLPLLGFQVGVVIN